jgi:hypothetical protein
MDYYTPPEQHPEAKTLCNLQDKLNKMVKEKNDLEDFYRDLTAEEEAKFYKLETDIKELNAYIDNIFLGGK